VVVTGTVKAAGAYRGGGVGSPVRALFLTPFLGTCPGQQDKTAVFCLQEELPMRMVADEGVVERD